MGRWHGCALGLGRGGCSLCVLWLPLLCGCVGGFGLCSSDFSDLGEDEMTTQVATDDGSGVSPAAAKWVYGFAEGSREMRELLGGKGAGIAEMTRILGAELVPAGFTITTQAGVA